MSITKRDSLTLLGAVLGTLLLGGCSTQPLPAPSEPLPEPSEPYPEPSSPTTGAGETDHPDVDRGGGILARERSEPRFFVTEVFFATDRNAETDNGRLRFSGRRGTGELSYGSVEVSIPFSHTTGEIESPRWYKFWRRKDPNRYVLVLSINGFSGRQEFTREVGALLTDASSDDVLVFVHGFNVDFEEAAKRTAQMAYDLQFTGAPIFYSWPSRGRTQDYPADEASIQWTAPHFTDFLSFVLADLGAKNVHLIAHSMGNRALLPALSALDPVSLPEGAAKLRQIILAAPDIDAGVFRQLAANFPGKADRITLYANENDRAIIASQGLHAEPRAGGAIIIVDGVDTIDASNVSSGFLNHSYFGDSIISDIFALIRNGLPPAERFGLRPAPPDAPTYWEIVP